MFEGLATIFPCFNTTGQIAFHQRKIQHRLFIPLIPQSIQSHGCRQLAVLDIRYIERQVCFGRAALGFQHPVTYLPATPRLNPVNHKFRGVDRSLIVAFCHFALAIGKFRIGIRILPADVIPVIDMKGHRHNLCRFLCFTQTTQKIICRGAGATTL